MRKGKLWRALAIAALLWTLVVPAMAEEVQEPIPYPKRTILYIVDCSGSMETYQEVLKSGRQMLLDLLPEETEVVAFDTASFTPGKTLTFSGDTSVLKGIEGADKKLKEIWEKNPKEEVTAVLFSDMYSTVEAKDGKTKLSQKDSKAAKEENRDLAKIARSWSEYIWDGKLRFYFLDWPSAEQDETQDKTQDGVRMSFEVYASPPERSESFQLPDLGEDMDFSQKILMACVGAYADILTGGCEAEWKSIEGDWSDDKLYVEPEEGYQEFLFLDKTPDRAVDSKGKDLEKWSSPSGCVVLLKGRADQACSFEGDGIAPGIRLMTFTVPQPEVKVDFSKVEEPLFAFKPVTITVRTTAGNNYLNYGDSGNSCRLRVTAPGETTPQNVPGAYDEEEGGYVFTYTPKTIGNHMFEIKHRIFGEKTFKTNLTYEKKVEVESHKLKGESLRKYKELSRRLKTIEKNTKESFELLYYYADPNMRLEFVVEEPENPEIAVWEASVGQTGAVEVQGRGEGTTTLCYTVNYYLEGIEEPCDSEDHKLTISVVVSSGSEPMLVWKIGLAVAAVVLAAAVAVIVLKRGRMG